MATPADMPEWMEDISKASPLEKKLQAINS